MYMVVVKKLHDTLPRERKQDAEKKYINHATIVKKIGNIMYIFAYFFTKIFHKYILQEYRKWLPTGDNDNQERQG